MQHPFPGWIDGFKVADPLIIAYGRGQLPEFPGLPDSILDLIPVDYVVNTILAAAANPAATDEPQYFHVSSGASNPLPFHRMFENVNRYFLENPMKGEPGKEIRVPTWKFPGGARSSATAAREAAASRRAAAGRMPERPGHRGTPDAQEQRRPRHPPQLHAALPRLRADRDHLRRQQPARPARRDPGQAQADRGFDIAAIDWEDYLHKVHFPAITGLTRRSRAIGRRRRPPIEAQEAAEELPERTDVVAVFDLEGTVVDSNIVQQYLWVRSAGFRKAAWPGEVPASSPRCRATCAPNAATAASSSAPSCAATRGCRSRASRRSCTAATATRSAGTRAPRRSGASGSTAPPGTAPCWSPGRSSAREPLAGLFDEVVAGTCTSRTACSPATSSGRRSSTRRAPPGCGGTPTSTASTSPARTATATATPTWSGSNCSVIRTR